MRRYLEQHPHAFDPETVRILGAALDDAWERLKAKEATVAGYDAARRDTLAKHIVDMAQQGERDHQRLVDGALRRLTL